VGLFETAYTVRLTTMASTEVMLYSLRCITVTGNEASSWGEIKTFYSRRGSPPPLQNSARR